MPEDIKLPPWPTAYDLHGTGPKVGVRYLTKDEAEAYTRAAVLADREARQQWTSVETKLPGEQGCDSEEVLCFLNGHCSLTDFDCRAGGGWGIRLGYYDAERGMFRIHGRPDAAVTHWQPLPAPPADAQRAKEK